MLRFIITLSILGLLFSSPVNAQRYTYSFSGTVKDSAAMVSKIQKLDQIHKCKLFLKPEKPGGVILFRVKPYEVTYDDKGDLINPKPLQEIKGRLLKEGLEPIALTQLKD